VRDVGCWVKLSGAYRMSGQGAPYADTVPFARALVAAAPDRMVWGSDWPHVALFDAAAMPQPGDLLDVLHDQLQDPLLERAVLVDNPARLYGLPGRQG
jgi:predicted TIM-barrel fold metal-dependent hydrolase